MAFLAQVSTQQVITKTITTSTLSAQYISTLSIWVSSINGALPGSGSLSQQALTSTVVGLGTVGYVSSAGGVITQSNLVSTVRGLGSAGYLSTGGGGGIATIPSNLSTSAFFTSSVTASSIITSSLQVNSLVIGTGTGWVNLGPLQTVAISSIQNNTNSLYANTVFVGTVSTVNAVQYAGLFNNYNNTALAEISTGAGTQELLVFKGSSASDRIRVQTTGNFVVETGVSARLWDSNTSQTLSNVTPAFIINTSSNVGIQTATPGATLDVAGTGRFVTLSTLALNVSSLNGSIPGSGGLSQSNLTSTVVGLGTVGYISTAGGGITQSNLVSTVQGLGTAGYLSTGGGGGLSQANLTSTVVGLGSVGYLSSIPAVLTASALLVSSAVISTATIGIMSSMVTIASTVTANIINTSTVATNAVNFGTNATWVLTAPLQNPAVSTNTLWADVTNVNTENVTTGIISTATINSLTLGLGSTWIAAGPIQSPIVSTVFAYASQPFFDTVNVGTTSTMNSIEYAGLFNNYNNTVLAEISTGAGTQEFLIFKGSSASDRVRVQTTGNFVIETGVSARLFNSNTTQTLSNVTPAFVINTSSNVGIQTANPGATLDVAGTVRAITVSTVALFASSIVAPYVFQPQFFTF